MTHSSELSQYKRVFICRVVLVYRVGLAPEPSNHFLVTNTNCSISTTPEVCRQ